VSSILQNFNCSAEVVGTIADDFDECYARDGIPVKLLLLAVELAIERDSNGALTRENFLECLDGIKGGSR